MAVSHTRASKRSCRHLCSLPAFGTGPVVRSTAVHILRNQLHIPVGYFHKSTANAALSGVLPVLLLYPGNLGYGCNRLRKGRDIEFQCQAARGRQKFIGHKAQTACAQITRDGTGTNGLGPAVSKYLVPDGNAGFHPWRLPPLLTQTGFTHGHYPLYWWCYALGARHSPVSGLPENQRPFRYFSISFRSVWVISVN